MDIQIWVALNCQNYVYFRLLAKMTELRNIKFIFCFKNTNYYLNYMKR